MSPALIASQHFGTQVSGPTFFKAGRLNLGRWSRPCDTELVTAGAVLTFVMMYSRESQAITVSCDVKLYAIVPMYSRE